MLGWKGFPWTNTLAYLPEWEVTNKKSFERLKRDDPGGRRRRRRHDRLRGGNLRKKKLFFSGIDGARQNKLECFPAKHFQSDLCTANVNFVNGTAGFFNCH